MVKTYVIFLKVLFQLGRQLKIHLYSHNIEGVTETMARISQNSEIEDFLSEERLKLAGICLKRFAFEILYSYCQFS